MTIQLPDLPYAKSALEPYITSNTLDYHHGKHHQAYVTNLNKLIDNTDYATLSLDDIIVKSGKEEKSSIFNNAAQVWNHTFYWHCMKTQGGGQPTGAIAQHINDSFGSYQTFYDQFCDAGLTQFGSGWAWLVLDNGQLKITKTGNADTPMVKGQKAILTCDVWEHAYYLDYQNKRADYIKVFLDHLVNWDFANKNLGN